MANRARRPELCRLDPLGRLATRPMQEVLARSRSETAVIARIEEPEGVEASAAIARTEGIDGLFLGPADLSVALGKTDQALPAQIEKVGSAAKTAGKAFVEFVAAATSAQQARIG